MRKKNKKTSLPVCLDMHRRLSKIALELHLVITQLLNKSAISAAGNYKQVDQDMLKKKVLARIIDEGGDNHGRGIKRFKLLRNLRPRITSKQLDQILDDLELNNLITSTKGSLKQNYYYRKK